MYHRGRWGSWARRQQCCLSICCRILNHIVNLWTSNNLFFATYIKFCKRENCICCELALLKNFSLLLPVVRINLQKSKLGHKWLFLIFLSSVLHLINYWEKPIGFKYWLKLQPYTQFRPVYNFADIFTDIDFLIKILRPISIMKLGDIITPSQGFYI